MSSKFLKEITRPTDPFYVRLIKGSDVLMPEFTNRGVFYTGTSGFGGTVVSNTTNPLFDVRDYIYTSGTTSNLDFWGYNYTIPSGILGKDASFKFNFKTATSNFVVAAYALCTSGNKLIYTSQPITIGTSLYEAVFNIPTDCTGLKLGWQYTGTASGETFEYDNIVFSQWTPQAVNLVEQQGYDSTTAASATYDGTVGNLKVEFPLTKGSGSSLFVKTTVGSHSRFTLLKTQKIDFSTTMISASAGNSVQLYKNGTVYRNGNEAATASDFMLGSFTDIGNAGDYYELGATDFLATLPLKLNITATAISENITQLWNPSDRIGETIYLPQNVAPRGFISAMGSSIGKTSGTYQGDTYFNLYKVLWNVALNTAGQPYYISAAKGTDALTDWNAGKTITIDESGLFTRAFKTGVTNGIGQKQDDAFQGHRHEVRQENGNAPSSVPSNSQSLFGANSIIANTNAIRDPITDGTNGTPRVASETRPVNVAKYVFIRYATSEPTVLALPAATQTEYVLEVNGNTSQSVVNTTAIPFTNIATNKNMNWNGTSASVPIGGMYKISGSILTSNSGVWGIGVYVNGSHRKSFWNASGTSTVVSFSGEIYLNPNDIIDVRQNNTVTAMTLAPSTTSHWLSITRINGKNDGVFVGNVAKNQVATLYANPATVASISGSFVDLTWDGVLGDSEIVTMTPGSASFTLTPGEYLLESEGICYTTGQSYHSLYNTSNSSEVEISTISHAGSGVDVIIKSGGKFSKLTLTNTTSFKIRQYANRASSAGFGSSDWTGKRAKLQITKLLGN